MAAGNFFGGEFFGGGFFGVNATLTGGKGDNERVPFKPTGLLHLPRRAKPGDKTSERVEQSREIHAEVAARLAREFAEQPPPRAAPPVEEMTLAEVEAEIGVLLRKKLRTEEEEILLMLLIASAT